MPITNLLTHVDRAAMTVFNALVIVVMPLVLAVMIAH
jgi:hypothetical protein